MTDVLYSTRRKSITLLDIYIYIYIHPLYVYISYKNRKNCSHPKFVPSVRLYCYKQLIRVFSIPNIAIADVDKRKK